MSQDKILSISNDVLMEEVGNRLAKGQRVKFRAKGNSMKPFIYDGDIVELVAVSVPKKQDIILAHTEVCGYILHRIIRIKQDIIVLQGDGNLYQKEYCRRTDILGKAIYVNGKSKFNDLSANLSRSAGNIWNLLLPLRRGFWYLKQLITK